MTSEEVHLSERTRVRKAVVQYLYAVDVQQDQDLDLSNYLPENLAGEQVQFAEELAKIVMSHLEEIDRVIEENTSNWNLDRLAVVDRNLLRLGVAEMKYFEETPLPIVINECVEVAKTLGSEDSHKFVNAVLDNWYEAEDVSNN